MIFDWLFFVLWLGITLALAISAKMWPRLKRWLVNLQIYRWWVTPVTTFSRIIDKPRTYDDLQAEDLEWLNGHLELAGEERIKLATVLDRLHANVEEAVGKEWYDNARQKMREQNSTLRDLRRKSFELEKAVGGFTQVSIDGRTESYDVITLGSLQSKSMRYVTEKR